MLKEILMYQQKDANLVKINKDLQNSQEKREVNKLVEQVKQAQNKLVSLENQAATLTAEFEKLKQTFQKKSKIISDLKSGDTSSMNQAQLLEVEAEIKKEISTLLNLSKEIKNLSTKINQTVSAFEKTKTQGVESKAKYKEVLNKFNALEDNEKSKQDKIRAEMEDLKKKINPKIMARYLELRDDHKFPILVPLNNNCCAICSTPLANARLDLLNKEGIVECENCHRIIYQKKEK